MEQFEELDELFSVFGIRPSEETEESHRDVSREDNDDQDDGWTDGGGGDDDDQETRLREQLEERVEQYVERIVDMDADDDDDDDDVDGADGAMEDEEFVAGLCKCKVDCLSKIGKDQVKEHKLSMKELEKTEKEMFVMGCLQRFGENETRGGKRKRTRFRFVFGGETLCKPAFCFINDVGPTMMRNVQKHFAANGAIPRTHGNTGKKPSHALKYQEVRYCVDWLIHYGDVNGLPMPAAPRGQDDSPPVLLQSHLTKKSLHTEYTATCRESEVRALGMTSFKSVWRNCVPHIRIMTPKDDVCHTCQLLRNKVLDAVTEHEKIEASTKLRDHVQDGQRERQVYIDSIREAEEELQGYIREPGPVPPLSTDFTKVHYTFDYSQNVTIPQHSQQMGPLYFISGRRIQMFGIRLDSTREQYNYLIDEDQSIGPDGTGTHGPNSVISMLHDCLLRHGFGEQSCVLHADNCGAQNKNRYVLAYLAWRIISNLHREITLLMGIPGHTKCLVDGGFGRVKKLFRRSDCETLQQFAIIVDKAGQHDFPVTFTNVHGEQTWKWYDWKIFLSNYFLPLKGIQKQHSFRFTSDDIGAVFVKERKDSQERRFQLLRRDTVVPPNVIPAEIRPAGLSRQRQKYLYDNVRQYLRPTSQDITCPCPLEE